MTKDQIEEVLVSFLTMLATFQKASKQLKSDTEKEVQNLIEVVDKKCQELCSEADDRKEELTSQFDSKIKEVRTMVTKCMEMMDNMPEDGKDGKDADEEYVIEEVLNRIKLPEFKEVVLDNGEQIVTKINDLPTNDEEYKIDFTHIKNVPEFPKQQTQNITTIIANAVDLDSTDRADGYGIVWDETNGRHKYSAAGGGSGINRVVQTKITDFTAGSSSLTDYVYKCTSALTATLPTAVGNKNKYSITNLSEGTITLETTSSQTINGSLTATMPIAYMSLDLISDGANWQII